MHPELYISSTKGLEDDVTALEMLKDSEMIAGIEGNLDIDSIEKIKSYGLRYSAQDLLMMNGSALSDDDICKSIPEGMIERSRLSDTDFVLFQGFSRKRGLEDMAAYEIKTNLKKNSGYLKELTGKEIAMEIIPYSEYDSFHYKKAIFNMIFDPRKLKNMVKDLGIGLALDIPHIMMTGEQYEKLNGSNDVRESILKYHDSLMEQLGDHVQMLRISVPGITKHDEYCDSNMPFDSSDTSREAYFLAKETIRRCQNIEAVVLDMATEMEPKAHVSYMEEQAKYLLDYLRASGYKRAS